MTDNERNNSSMTETDSQTNHQVAAGEEEQQPEEEDAASEVHKSSMKRRHNRRSWKRKEYGDQMPVQVEKQPKAMSPTPSRTAIKLENDDKEVVF